MRPGIEAIREGHGRALFQLISSLNKPLKSKRRSLRRVDIIADAVHLR